MAPDTAATTEYEVQGYYGYGWEMVTTEETKAQALDQLRCYNENEPHIPHRIKRVRTSS